MGASVGVSWLVRTGVHLILHAHLHRGLAQQLLVQLGYCSDAAYGALCRCCSSHAAAAWVLSWWRHEWFL
jgi:hypothetical protein